MEKVRVFVIGVVSELQYYDDFDPQWNSIMSPPPPQVSDMTKMSANLC